MLPKKVMLLLGAGVSLPSDPNRTTEKLTKELFNENWHFVALRNSFAKVVSVAEDDTAKSVRMFLLYLKREFFDKCIYQRAGEFTYENVFWLVTQLQQFLSFHLPQHNADIRRTQLCEYNPFLNLIVEKIKKDMIHIYQKHSLTDFSLEEQLHNTLGNCYRYINEVIAHNLHEEVKPRGFDLIGELIDANKVKSLDIFTLNHDTLLESYLRSRSDGQIEYADGFESTTGVRRFSTSAFKHRVRVIKLHGSVDWFEVRDYKRNTAYLIQENPNNISRNMFGEKIFVRPNPIFLSGVDTKILAAQFGLYGELQSIYKESLLDSDLVLVSGYGFHDKIINMRLFERFNRGQCVAFMYRDDPPPYLNLPESFYWRRHKRDLNKWMCDVRLSDIERAYDEILHRDDDSMIDSIPTVNCDEE